MVIVVRIVIDRRGAWKLSGLLCTQIYQIEQLRFATIIVYKFYLNKKYI